jgi:hypothetical protein
MDLDEPSISKTLKTFGLSSFSTKQFVERYKSLYPSQWKSVEAAYGKGGKGAGKFYSSNSRISQTLNSLWKNGEIAKLDYQPAPAGWGSPVIRIWTLNRERLGGRLFPDETNYDEGKKIEVRVNRYERDPAARLKCIEHYGLDCSVCGVNFERLYGPQGAGFIHVHHVVEVSKGGRRKIDPIKDLRPICPNCHGVIHYNSPMLTIEQVRKILKKTD